MCSRKFGLVIAWLTIPEVFVCMTVAKYKGSGHDLSRISLAAFRRSWNLAVLGGR